MSLPFPYPFYGWVYDSNSTLVSGALVVAASDSTTSDTTDSTGRYMMNLQDYTSSGSTVNVTVTFEGEKKLDTWTVDIHLPGKNVNYTLEEAIQPNEAYVNTNKFYGNEVYIFSPNAVEGYMKTSDY